MLPDRYAVRSEGDHFGYDAAPDGRRLLVVEAPATSGGEMRLVFNWTEELKRLAPPGGRGATR